MIQAGEDPLLCRTYHLAAKTSAANPQALSWLRQRSRPYSISACPRRIPLAECTVYLAASPKSAHGVSGDQQGAVFCAFASDGRCAALFARLALRRAKQRAMARILYSHNFPMAVAPQVFAQRYREQVFIRPKRWEQKKNWRTICAGRKKRGNETGGERESRNQKNTRSVGTHGPSSDEQRRRVQRAEDIMHRVCLSSKEITSADALTPGWVIITVHAHGQLYFMTNQTRPQRPVRVQTVNRLPARIWQAVCKWKSRPPFGRNARTARPKTPSAAIGRNSGADVHYASGPDGFSGCGPQALLRPVLCWWTGVWILWDRAVYAYFSCIHGGRVCGTSLT